MRRPSVICSECNAVWDARTAGFCGWCGALLDSPAAPTGISREPTAPSERRAPRPDRGSNATVTFGLIALVALLIAGVAMTRGVDPMDNVGVDLPANAEEAVDPPQSPNRAPALEGLVSERPTCEDLATGREYECILWERASSLDPEVNMSGMPVATWTDHGIFTVEGGAIRLLDAATGDILWEQEVASLASGGYGAFSPDGAHVFVFSDLSRPLVVNVADREIIEWESLPGRQYHLQPVGTDRAAEVTRQLDDEGLWTYTVALRALDGGTELWRQSFEDLPQTEEISIGTVEDGLLVTTCCRQDDLTTAVLLDLDTGAIRWRADEVPYPWEVFEDQLLTVHWGDSEGDTPPSMASAAVIDAATGATVWSTEDLGMTDIVNVTTHQDLILVSTSGSRGLIALDRRSGAVRWERADMSGWVGGHMWRPPGHVDHDALIVHGDDGTVRRIEPESGTVLWEQSLSTHWSTVRGDRVVVQGPAGVTMLDLSSGTPLLRLNAHDAEPVSLDPLVMSTPGRLFRVDTAPPELDAD